MLWQPLNLSDVCPASTAIAACSPFAYTYLNLLVQLFGGPIKTSNGNDYKNAEDNGQEEEDFDFIVVGAGSAGCIVANRLSENPFDKVLLLEAGSEQPEITLVPGLSTVLLGSSVTTTFTTQPNGKSCLSRPGKGCPWQIGTVMGGSSTVNSFAYVRGNKVDYDDWEALGNKGWSYDEVLPFFKKSENNVDIELLDRKYHGTSGEQYVSFFPYTDRPAQTITNAFVEKGIPYNDYNGAYQVGSMQAQAISLEGERFSAATAFIEPIRYKRKNLIVRIKSKVIKILIDQNKKAYGVVYVRNGQTFTAYAKKEIIVSAGCINSAKLLMLSGIGPKDQLDKFNIPVIEELAVGENLHDHVSFNGLLIVLPNKTATTLSEDETLRDIKDYANMKVKRGPLAGNGPAITIAFIKTDPNLSAPDIQYHVGHIPDWRTFVKDPLAAELDAIYPTSFYDGVVPRTMNLVPKSRGVLMLNETDPFSSPLLYVNYLGDDADLEPLLKGIRFLLSLEDTETFKSIGAYFYKESLPACKNHEWGTDEYFICLIKAYTATTYHYGGTCKMGPKSDKKAVVDNELRVYGICGLRVIDASIMPHVVRGNTNAASMMIGERGVDFVIKYWLKNYHGSCYYA